MSFLALTLIQLNLFIIQFTCSECEKTYEQQKQLNYHIKRHHAKNLDRYICPSCSATYAPYPLKTHLKEKHKLDVTLKELKNFNHPVKNSKALQAKQAKKKGNFKARKGETCIDCGKYFSRKYNHDRHLLTCRGKNVTENSSELADDKNCFDAAK